MKNLTRKAFSLGELRYGSVLLLSIVICIVAFYVDEHVNPTDQLWLAITYYISFSLAAIWCGANYIGHIRMNNLYRKHHDIRAYVEQLVLSMEDKTELLNYLEDFAADLEQQGQTKEEAAKAVINQFQVKELLTMSKHTKPFESHGHHYLLGYGILFLGIWLVVTMTGKALTSMSLALLITNTVALVYGVCFLAVFFLYKVLDRLIYNKLRNYFS